MSEISVTVNGSTTINPTVGNGDVVNVTFSATGERGPKGDTGSPGPANTLTIGTVASGNAAATITGTAPNQTLNLTLPQGSTGQKGDTGDTGPAGPANTLTIGTVTSGAAAATITGTPPNQVLSLTLPKGDKGDTGATGGFTSVVAGTTTTGNPGTKATVSSTTSGDTVTLNFTIPRGADGSTNLSDETPQPLGTASAGTALAAARADHIHPTLASFPWSGLTGVPSTFAPATHVHPISAVTGLQDALDGKQASGSYCPLVNGLVPSANLPSYVDDVVDVGGTLPATGEVGKIYVVSTGTNTNKIYRWSGSTFIEISPSPGSTDAVPEGSTNLYFTTKRAADAAPVQSVNKLTGALTIAAGENITVTSSGSTVTIAGSGSGGGSSILQYTTEFTLPIPGNASALYITTDTQRIFRWDSSNGVYVELGPQ